uniref:Uncharacterized protein n=1 Tax=Oryza glumipatula TaxID=40148 RepID=A0A0E0AZW2_9ORYZ
MSLCFTHLKANGQYTERPAEVQSIGAIYGQTLRLIKELAGIPHCRRQRRPVLDKGAPRSAGGEAGGGGQKREAEAAMAPATPANSEKGGGLMRFIEARGVPGWR